jgi:carboxymethylenebutenolidase
MQETELDIKTADGEMNTFVTYPEEGGPYPVVLFLMDAPGKREELHDMARRIGTAGYFVILPNLYYRKSRDFVMTSRDVMVEHMNSLSNRMAVDDCQVLLDWAKTQSAASDGPAGTVGYCMSGPFAFAASGQLSDRIKAGASFHGVRLFTDAKDSPHLDANQIDGEFYIGCAETDDWAPPEMIDQLEAYLKDQQVNARVEWYPETEHGFVFPDRVGKYHKASAERHYERLLAIFERQLKL